MKIERTDEGGYLYLKEVIKGEEVKTLRLASHIIADFQFGKLIGIEWISKHYNALTDEFLPSFLISKILEHSILCNEIVDELNFRYWKEIYK